MLRLPPLAVSMPCLTTSLQRRYHQTMLLLSVFLLIQPLSALKFTMIPDQETSALNARGDAVSAYLDSYLTATCGIQVDDTTYVPVSDYQEAVEAFVNGSVDFAWFGGLTGVDASLRDPDAIFVAQRIEDQQFTSVFIQADGLDLKSLEDVEGKTLALGSPSSTSGRLMPEYFLRTSFVEPKSIVFTGSHDNTIDVIKNGTYEVGALNMIVWEQRLASGTTGNVTVFYVTPQYPDYLWAVSSKVPTIGTCENISQVMQEAFLQATNETAPTLLESFGAEKFVTVNVEEYQPIEEIGCSLGLIAEQYCRTAITSPPTGAPSPAATSHALCSHSAAELLLCAALLILLF